MPFVALVPSRSVKGAGLAIPSPPPFSPPLSFSPSHFLLASCVWSRSWLRRLLLPWGRAAKTRRQTLRPAPSPRPRPPGSWLPATPIKSAWIWAGRGQIHTATPPRASKGDVVRMEIGGSSDLGGSFHCCLGALRILKHLLKGSWRLLLVLL